MDPTDYCICGNPLTDDHECPHDIFPTAITTRIDTIRQSLEAAMVALDTLDAEMGGYIPRKESTLADPHER